jgi:N-acetyl-anhydromuramyl-L-alanine amidase AmpD
MAATRLPNTAFHHNSLVEHGRRSTTRGVVIHTIEGTDESAEAWFANRQAGGIGAHVIIGQEKQRTIQTADLDALCWHATGANSDHIGIEHEGYASMSKVQWLSKANRKLLRASANRTAWICWHYKLGAPRKGHNVFGHADFPAGGHHDPGKGWPWTFYIWLARRAYKTLVKSNGKKWS